MTNYNPNPITLDELVAQSHEWDGDVIRVVPYFDEAGRLDSVGIWIVDQHAENPQEDELCYRRTARGWHLCGDGAGDPSTNGGSVLTGRDLG